MVKMILLLLVWQHWWRIAKKEIPAAMRELKIMRM